MNDQGHSCKAKPTAMINSLHHSTISVMLRSIDGSIFDWNRAAERNYGWKKHQALGNVSHELLGTVFPSPLTEINRQLLETGSWEGELIHTLSDGSRVKVNSKWELQSFDHGHNSVVETNQPLSKLQPETSFLRRPMSRRDKMLCLFLENKGYLLVPLLAGLIAMFILMEFFHHQPIAPSY